MSPKAFLNFIFILFALTLFPTHTQYNFIDWPYIKSNDQTLITSRFLQTKIAPNLNITYLQQTIIAPSQKVTGIIWPQGNHNFISLPVKLFRKHCPQAINVIFKVSTGVSYTTLSPATFSQLYAKCGITKELLYDDMVVINGREQRVYPLRKLSNQEDINLLGTHFMFQNNVRMVSRNGMFTLEFVVEEQDEQPRIDTVSMLGERGEL